MGPSDANNHQAYSTPFTLACSDLGQLHQDMIERVEIMRRVDEESAMPATSGVERFVE